MMGSRLEFSDRLHAQKYRLPGEDFRESMNRVAYAMKDTDAHYRAMRNILLNMRFAPGGRIQAAMGAPKSVTAYNCFVSGTINDSFVDGEGSIMQRASEAAQTMRMGGGIGYDFSTLRPKGDLIKGVGATTDGPMAFLPIFDAICKATSSSGNRRGAQMGVMRIDHPDIEAFVRAKQALGVLEGFNLSIAVTDEFMECLQSGSPFSLRFNGKEYGRVDPRALWEAIMRSTWDWGDPGVLFIDTINRMNNLWYCEEITSTNPCAEQPLPPFGACLLGSFNLTKYIDTTGFNWPQMYRDIQHVTRAMDNVIDISKYPLPQQAMEAKSKRRMGLGITGLANAAEILGHPYGSAGFLNFEKKVLQCLLNGAYIASVDLAKEKGPFPLFDRDKYLQSKFISKLPFDIQEAIYKHGIRNSHLTSIAPTGTISFCMDYISSGIEPVFQYESTRMVNMPEGQMQVNVSDYAYREYGVHGVLTKDVTAKDHIHILAVASEYVDSAVSKTINVDGDMPWEDFKNVYMDAWRRGCKGCTTFNSDGKKMGILMGKTKDKAWTCDIDPNTGQKECG